MSEGHKKSPRYKERCSDLRKQLAIANRKAWRAGTPRFVRCDVCMVHIGRRQHLKTERGRRSNHR